VPIGPGTKLGQYVVQDAIGEGAMGVVYRAYHPQLERTGAVKVLHGIGLDLDSAARFRREAQAIAQLRHPNVLNVFDKLNAPQTVFTTAAKCRQWMSDDRFEPGSISIRPYKGVSYSLSGVKQGE